MSAAKPTDGTAASAGVDAALRRRIYRRILAHVRNPTEAEDLTQETLVRVHRGLANFRGESSLETWASRIAVNVVRDHRRRSAGGTADGPATAGELESLEDRARPGPEIELEKFLSAECLRRALESLPAAYREAVELHDVEGLDNPQITDLLGVPISTVKIRVHRGRRLLRSACQDECSVYRDVRGDPACCPKEPEPS